MAGNVLELPGQKLFVDEACSGIQSLVAIVAFTALFVVLTERPCVRAILLLCGSVFWAVAANLVRIVTIAVVKVEAGLDLSSGWRHELLGLGMFLLLLLMCLSTDRICEFLFAPVNLVGRGNLLSRAWNWSMGGTPQRLDSADASDSDATLVGDRPASVESAFEPARSRMFGSRAVAALYLALGVVQVLALRVPKPAAGDLTGSPTRLLAIAESLEGELLPEEQAGWRRTDFSVRQRDQRSEFGEFSRIWSYQSAGAAAAFALDYPFYGWHDLTACYRGQGWEVAQRRVVTVERGDGEPGWSYIEAELRRPDGDLSYLYFSLFDQFGRPLAPPVAGHWSDRLRSLTRVPTWKLLTRQESLALLPAAAQGQAQLFVEVGEPFSEVQRQQLAERFVTFRNAVQRRYALPRETAE
jgi:exosortase/archaeosortase family protein